MLAGCCRDPPIPIHSGKLFAATQGSITTIMSLDRSVIPQRWRPNWPIWRWPGSRGPQSVWHAIMVKVASQCRSRVIFVMMLDGERRPRFIWRTTEVTIKPLSQADEAFAWDEGEGDRTRDWWLDAHRRYFARQASREGFDSERSN